MIRTIAAKEFLTSLLTWRFGLAVAASIVLLSVSAAVLRADYARRLDAHEAELARIRADLEDTWVYATLEETVSRPPSPLSVFSEGLEKRMGTILRFSYAKVPTMLTWKKETNPLVAAFPPFDLATVAGLLFSLMALFFAFDAVSGEQERNTLKLMAANRVARWQILVGKWLGGGACSLLPAAVGFLVATLILAGSPWVSLSGGQWLRVGLIFAAVVLYTSAFYLVGLAVSSRARQSGTALVACIAVWAGCTIVAPTATAYVVGEAAPLPPERELRAQWEEINRQFTREFFSGFGKLEEEFGRRMETDHGKATTSSPSFGLTTHMQGMSVDGVGGMVGFSELFKESIPVLTEFYGRHESRRIAAGGDIAEVEDRLVHARARQVRLSGRISRLFVAPAFRSAVTALAGTDLRTFERFIDHARRHRAALADWMREQGLFTSVLFFNSVPEDQLHSREETLRRFEERGRRVLEFGEGGRHFARASFPGLSPLRRHAPGWRGSRLGCAARSQRPRLRPRPALVRPAPDRLTTLLGVLVWKELLEHLRSLRFAVSYGTIVGLFVLGAAVWNLRIAEERQGYLLGVEEYEETIRDAADALARLHRSTHHFWLPPAGLTFASGGYSRSLPNVALTHQSEHVWGFEQRADRNPMLFRIDPDWVFIAGTLATLMALLLTYDGVAGEKERGCLRQLLANRVPRDQVLIAKYLAGLAMAAAPIVTGAAAAVAVIQLLGQGLPGDRWPALAGVMIAALLCVSAFLWLGLWASSRTHNSALALLVSLVVWALLAVFLPQAGVLAGDHLVEVPSLTEARRASWEARENIKGDEERLRVQQRTHRHYWDLLLQQVKVARDATLVSPVAALSLASEALTVTGVVRHREFVEQTHEHLREFEDYLRRKGDEGPDSAHGLHPKQVKPENQPWYHISKKPVPQGEVPRFQFRPPSLRERLDAALVPLLVLVIANGVCFLGAYFSFRRYDVR